MDLVTKKDQSGAEVGDRLGEVHANFRRLSERFKAAWTFHQFSQGLNKVFADLSMPVAAVSFQTIYGDLKAISSSLHSAGVEVAAQRLETVAKDLEDRFAELLNTDEEVSAPLMRRFFSRVRNYDENLLSQLLRFYAMTSQKLWHADRRDKVDFLLSRLGHELLGLDRDPIERDPRRFSEAMVAVWRLVGDSVPPDYVVTDHISEIRTLREAMASLDSLESLNQLGLLSAFRHRKVLIDRLVMYPPIATEVAATNLYLRNLIERFYELEEHRVAEASRQVFELEREAVGRDEDLDGELRRFRSEVQSLEESIDRQNVKITSLVQVGHSARALIPRLEKLGAPRSRAEDAAPVPAAGDSAQHGLPTERPTTVLRLRTAHAVLLGESLAKVFSTLEKTDWGIAPAAVAKRPEMRRLRLEAREVLAFRRLHFEESFDRELEQFIVESAALRLLMSELAEEIALPSVPGEEEQNRERGRRVTRLASAFEARFHHFFETAMVEQGGGEAAALQRLRFRFLREYTGLWLLDEADDESRFDAGNFG